MAEALREVSETVVTLEAVTIFRKIKTVVNIIY
jgi:hypothetical protein